MQNKEISQLIGGKPKLLVDVKGWLIYFNLVIDLILDHSNTVAYTTSIWVEEELTNFETTILKIEDKRYFSHSGVDIYCAPRLIKQLVTKKRLGGISTIEQQYVRTVINKKERTIKRKSQEMILSWLITKRLSKEKALRSYLSSAYFGYKLNNCDEASILIFNRLASDIAQQESAILASLLVYPLPKQVYNSIKLDSTYYYTTAEEFFDYTAEYAPNWTKKIKRRALYAYKLTQT